MFELQDKVYIPHINRRVLLKFKFRNNYVIVIM